MNKVAVRTHGGEQWVWYYCPGCKELHGVPAKRWNWNGDLELPTLHPSVRHYHVQPDTNQQITHCHYHVKGGVIEFCDDCPHELKGQKVELQEPTAQASVPDDS